MIYEPFGALKFKYRNREFWFRGYYVDTVGKNKAKISEYIRHHLTENKLGGQLSLPYVGAPVTEMQVSDRTCVCEGAAGKPYRRIRENIGYIGGVPLDNSLWERFPGMADFEQEAPSLMRKQAHRLWMPAWNRGLLPDVGASPGAQSMGRSCGLLSVAFRKSSSAEGELP